ncbi:uncharacterized protein FA14DRAFT_173530 [Meira miltonrushii]|uniref:EF-hand domain-containing protein n=1 Tax=Meira miltonrushii TaxID=1280837 RepID=A0A316V8F1_9BASI|nr:uncharacterized protein FA14DRAFT_173530 [Meira miltonrushii]PWN33776.1 hypothetical protein FA14DRAFT_173530 [Meira miltonrushii]
MHSSSSLVLAVALLGSATTIHAHLGDENIPPAEIANEAPHRPGQESYIQRHMASEHHIGAFDLGSFFALHDLNRDGVLDRSEIEAIYGVHHSTSVKHSQKYEVHDEKANKIVKEVLRRLDQDNDGQITLREFESAGADGLPTFEEFGHNVLGHHYDEESEYFVHHEQVYHNTPESQKEEAYTHKEDIEHFAHHDKIEAEEERRERAAEGMPSAEEDARRKAEAAKKGEKYVSPYEAQVPKEDSPVAPQHAYDSHVDHGYGRKEGWRATEHVFKTPEGEHVVKSDAVAAEKPKHGELKAAGASAAGELDHDIPRRVPGETDEGYKDRLTAHAQAKAAAAEYAKANPNLSKSSGFDEKTGKVIQAPGESTEDYLVRKARYQFANTAARPAYEPAKKEQLRKSAPYKVSNLFTSFLNLTHIPQGYISEDCIKQSRPLLLLCVLSHKLHPHPSPCHAYHLFLLLIFFLNLFSTHAKLLDGFSNVYSTLLSRIV